MTAPFKLSELEIRVECAIGVALMNAGHDPEVFKRKFWLTFALTLPIVVTSEMVMDWLSAGLDPHRSTIFRQSRVKEHAELHLLFSMITPVPWLERNPTYKDQLKELVEKDLSTYGFLGYADAYGEAWLTELDRLADAFA